MDADAATMIDAPTSQKSLDFSQPEIGDLPGGDVELNPFEQLPPEAQQFLVDKGYGPADQDPKNPFTAEDYLDALKREGFGTTNSGATDPGMGREGREDRLSFADMYRQAQEQGTPFGDLSEEDAGLLYDRGYSEGMPDVPAYGAEQIASLLYLVKNPQKKTSGPPRVDPNAPRGTKMDELHTVQQMGNKFENDLAKASARSNDNPSGTTPKVLEQRIRDGVKAYQAATAPSEAELSGFRTKSPEGTGGQTMSAGDAQKFANNPDMKNPVTESEGRNTGGAVPVAAPTNVGPLPTFSPDSVVETPGSVITDAINQTEALANMQQNPVTKTLLDGNEPNANTPQPQQKNPFAPTAGMEPEPVGTPSAQQAAVEPPQPGFFSRDRFSGDLRDGSSKKHVLGTGFLEGRFQNTPYPVTQATQNLFETVIPNPRAAQIARLATTGGITNMADLALRRPVYSTLAGLTGMSVKSLGDSIYEQQAMEGSVPGVAMRMDEDGNVIPVETPIAAPATEEMQTDLQSQADQALKDFGDFVTGQSQFKKLEATQQQLRQEDNIRKLREGI